MKLRSIWATAGAIVGAITTVLSAGGRMPQTVELKVGDTAPAFELQGSDGKVHRLSDHKGKAVVLAWFPKAFTGG
jgi:peroxiredoxin